MLDLDCCRKAPSESIVWTDGFLPNGACFDDPRKRRFALWRRWSTSDPIMGVVMLNPSDANEQSDDPTIRRVIDYAKRWGHGGICVVNTITWITKDPRVAMRLPPLDLGDNLDHLDALLSHPYVTRVMVGWGGNMGKMPRLRAIFDDHIARLAADKTYAWVIKGGQPGHPLYLRKDIVPVSYPGQMLLDGRIVVSA